MGYTWLGMRKLTWEEVLQRHEKGELAWMFQTVRLQQRGYDRQRL